MKRIYQVRYIGDWYALKAGEIYECELFIEDRVGRSEGRKSWCIISGEKKGKIFMYVNGAVENDFEPDIPSELFEL
jgi:hypothetical protein